MLVELKHSGIDNNRHLPHVTFPISAMVADTLSISVCDQMWIGANDYNQSGQFVWTDSRPFQYANWAQGTNL
jgi:hypothetical protein